MERGNMQKSNDLKKPVVLVFAGPNGSGKTTVTKSISCDNIIIYDNSDTPYKIFSKGEERRTEIHPNKHWSESDIRRLLGL